MDSGGHVTIVTALTPDSVEDLQVLLDLLHEACDPLE